MRRKNELFLVTWLLSTGSGWADDAVKEDLAALQGSWQIVGKEFMGKKATREEVAKLKETTVIKGGTITEWWDDAGETSVVSEAAFTFNPKAKPKALDLTYSGGMFKGEKQPAIYELDGDSLRVCYAMLNQTQQRPTEFAGKGDGKALLLTYKRVKK